MIDFSKHKRGDVVAVYCCDSCARSAGVDGVCTRSTCECEREGLGDQCVWLKPAEAEFECLGEPSLCANPRGCACFQAGRTDRPSTPVGWSDTDWLKHLEEIRKDQETYHRGPLPETGWD